MSQPSAPRWDFFLSHASEDKPLVAEPLATALKKLGFKVWFDKEKIGAGDSIPDRIDEGLRLSRRGIAIVSRRWLDKYWTTQERDAIFALEATRRQQLLVPVLHGIKHDELVEISPLLGGRLSLDTSVGIEDLAEAIARTADPAGPVPRLPAATPPSVASVSAPIAGPHQLEQNRLERLLAALPRKAISWLDAQTFAYPWPRSLTIPFEFLVEERSSEEDLFVDPALRAAQENLRRAIQAFRLTEAYQGFRHRKDPTLRDVGIDELEADFDPPRGELYVSRYELLEAAANQVRRTYDDLLRIAASKGLDVSRAAGDYDSVVEARLAESRAGKRQSRAG